MRNSAIQNTEYNTRPRQNILNIKYNKPYEQIYKYDAQNILSDRTHIVNAPCDAEYLIKRGNINFKSSKYDIKTLNPKQLTKVRDTVIKKINKYGLNIDRRVQSDLLDTDKLNSNIVIQSMNMLLGHPIFKLESVRSCFVTIMLPIQQITNALPHVKNMFDFADFITSADNKPIYNIETVQDFMGTILVEIVDHNVSSVEYKKHFVTYLLNHNEILSYKNVNIGEKLASINKSNYPEIINYLSTVGKVHKNGNPDLLFDLLSNGDYSRRKDRGTVVEKKGDNSGFARIGGQHQAIAQLEDVIVLPLKCAELYGAFKTPKGAILCGPPGTGKSLMAKALAEELGYYYVSISAGDMKNMYVGGTENNWNNLFMELKQNQPALLFIDEVDNLASNRDNSNEYSRQELGHVLKLISDIHDSDLNIFVLTATNRLQDVDPAFIRSGRIEEVITMLPPQTIKDVEEIFDIHKKGKKIDIEDINKHKNNILRCMLDLRYTGADIEKVVFSAHRAALLRTGLREKIKSGTITQEDIENFNIKTEDFFTAFRMDAQDTIANKNQKHVNIIPPKYLTKQSKANTVAVLGSSKTTDEISKYITICSDTVKNLILNGKNIVTGCGNSGIMGAAYDSAKKYSEKDEQGRPKQNLAILTNPLWGDEDIENCILLTAAKSQAERIENFSEVADTIIIFPGSVTTLQEASTLIAKNYNGVNEDKKNIILVGKSFFKNIVEHYNNLYNENLIKCSPSELFTLVDSEEEISQIIKY